MAVAMTFTSLIADLQTYLERAQATDPQVFDQLPSLINLAERDISVKLKILGMEETLVSAMVAGTSIYPKPDRWRQTTSLNFGTGATFDDRNPLFARSYEYLRTYWPNPTVQGVPKFYADHGYAHWLFAPTPDDDYPFEAKIYAIPALLDNANQTNWLTDYAPNALLYATLTQAAPYVRDEGRMALWQGLYNDQLGALDGQDLQRIIDRSVTRQKA